MADDKRSEAYKGNLINTLMGIVDSAIASGDAKRELVRSAMRVAYTEGRLDGIVEGVKRTGATQKPVEDEVAASRVAAARPVPALGVPWNAKGGR
jgi:hypothetical protein